MKALMQIAELERELIELANLLAGAGFLIKLCRSGKIADDLEKLAKLYRLRIIRAQTEIAALENAYFAEIQIAGRNAKYPSPVETQPLKMEIYE